MKLNKKNIILSMASLSLVAAVFFFNPQKAQAKDVTFRVTDYGATGNGQTDDTKAINQLLDEAAYLSDGDTLVLTFPAGRYNISDWLHIRSNTTLDLSAGAELYRTNTMYPLMMNVGNDGTRKENSSSGGGYKLSENIKIIGGTINGGNIAKAATTGNVVNFAHAQNIELQGVTFNNCYGAHLLEFSGVKDSIVHFCDFSGFRPEMASDTALNFDSGLNTTGYSAKECIQLDYTYFNTKNKNLQWCPSYYSDKTPCENITIESNTFHDYPRGIGNHHGRETFSDLYTDHITIRNNAFTNMTVTAPNGKAIYDHTILLHSFKNALVENNTITNAGSGVLLVYDSNSTIRNNTISALQSSAIILSKNTSGSNITLNHLTDIPRYGISVTGTASANSFTNNTLTTGLANKKMINGVTVTGASASIKTISGNTINNCSQFGISLLSVKKVQNVLSNTISNCAKGAVCVAKSKCNSLSNNTITGAENMNSVIISGKTNLKKISKNTIRYSGKNAISVGGASTVSYIGSNTITNSSGNGICVFDHSKVGSVTKNKVTKSKIGISVLKSRCNKVTSNIVNTAKKSGICSTTATLNYVQKNKVSNTKKGGIIICKKSKAKRVAQNSFSKVKGKKIGIDRSSKVKKKK